LVGVPGDLGSVDDGHHLVGESLALTILQQAPPSVDEVVLGEMAERLVREQAGED
jgi:hypothetical protein